MHYAPKQGPGRRGKGRGNGQLHEGSAEGGTQLWVEHSLHCPLLLVPAYLHPQSLPSLLILLAPQDDMLPCFFLPILLAQLSLMPLLQPELPYANVKEISVKPGKEDGVAARDRVERADQGRAGQARVSTLERGAAGGRESSLLVPFVVEGGAVGLVEGGIECYID